MRHCWLLLLLWGCPAADAKAPDSPSATVTLQAVGDTAKGFFSWSAVRGATNYRYWVTVANTNGTWTGLPFAVSTAALSASFKASSTTADSADFLVCMRSYTATDSSVAGCSAMRHWKRPLGVPVVIWDSLKVSSIQKTAGHCRKWMLDPKWWDGPCPLAAWEPQVDEFMAYDNQGTVRVCYVDSTMGFGWPWPEPPKSGRAPCWWYRLG